MEIDSILCPLCECSAESSRHLFFSCKFVSDVMRKISRWWDMEYQELNSFEDWRQWISTLRMPSKLKQVFEGGEWIIEREMTMISKDGKIYKFPEYHSSEEEEPTEQPRSLNKYGFVEHPQLQLGNQTNGFVPHLLPQQEGNMNGYAAIDDEVESDLESTTRSEPMCKEREDTREKMAPFRRSGPSNEENPNIATIIAQQLQNILPRIVTQVTNNVNNANGKNGGNNGCSYKGFMACNPKEYDGREVNNEMEKLETEFWNHKMVGSNHAGYTDRFNELAKLVPHLVTHESSRIKRYIAGLAPKIRVMKKRKGVEETSKQGGWGNDNKRVKVSKGFVAATPHRNGYARSHPKCAKCWTHHPEGGPY
ncbi:hypothetical protein Tco_1197580 [Tanacetum coccineum]